MDVTCNIYCGFQMTKFRYKTISRKPTENAKAKSIPRKIK